MGKVSFCDLYDRRGKIQIFTKIDNLPEEEYAAWQNLDIGDLVGVEGEVYLARAGCGVGIEGDILFAEGVVAVPAQHLGD